MKIKGLYKRYMLRPLIYLTAYRTMVALIILLALERLVKNGPSADFVAAFLSVAFALLAYLVYLRMDGVRLPRVKYVRPKKKPDPLRNIGSMADYTDEDPGVSFDELEEDERDFCSLMANLINLVIFLAASFLL